MYMYIPTRRTAVARYGFPNTTLQLERIDLALAYTRGEGGEKKMGNLNNIITPSGEVACWPRALYCQRRRGKKNMVYTSHTHIINNIINVCVYIYMCSVTAIFNEPNRKFKTKKCKKFYLARVLDSFFLYHTLTYIYI